MVYSSLTLAHEDGVGTIAFCRPPTNAINGKVLDGISLDELRRTGPLGSGAADDR
jgi:hypothetical protein